MHIIQLSLTCVNEHEAYTIAVSLLEKRLIACAKMTPVTAHFTWQGALESSNEILILMESVVEKFDAIEQEVRKLHSYTTFVLMATEVAQASVGVAQWIEESVR